MPTISLIQGSSQVLQGSNLTFSCEVAGDPVPNVYWTKNGSRDIPSALYFNMNRTLLIANVQQSAEGVYQCIAWNRAGNTTSSKKNVTVFGKI